MPGGLTKFIVVRRSRHMHMMWRIWLCRYISTSMIQLPMKSFIMGLPFRYGDVIFVYINFCCTIPVQFYLFTVSVSVLPVYWELQIVLYPFSLASLNIDIFHCNKLYNNICCSIDLRFPSTLSIFHILIIFKR